MHVLANTTDTYRKVGKPVPVASTSKSPVQESSKGKSKDEALKPKDEPKQDAESKPAVEKPKRSGTLDWSKAKVKGQNDKTTKEKETKTPPKPQTEPKPKAEPEAKVELKSKPKPIPKPKMEEEESSAAEENRKENIGKGTNADGSMKFGPPKVNTALLFEFTIGLTVRREERSGNLGYRLRWTQNSRTSRDIRLPQNSFLSTRKRSLREPLLIQTRRTSFRNQE